MPNHPRRFSTRYELSDEQLSIIIRFLAGELTSREAAAALGCSHQHVLNLVAGLAKQWYQEGKLKI